ncbi:uncharacterized protein MAM_02710 [Metarhizium album ARSEF 1941]|uniref:Uncharacterized protein n=1 Tax=Metarhizium album (strain ARSEF 1941) TaxID=1081103 RepID=A0A0B2WZZ9_METAS|nr:uncharacterized protein MAM_02710 [Metarhizium album ARSEF 1941]KHN99012.1 hypothetical protein MAM_02710 [Metarhizium album ARSEF 1941]
MPTTRRGAAALAGRDSNHPPRSLGRANASQTTSPRVAGNAASITTPTRGTGKRNRRDAKPDAPVAKRPALGRPSTRTGSRTALEDENEDDVPRDQTFYDEINEKAALRAKAKRRFVTWREYYAAAEEQLLQESQQSERHAVPETSEQGNSSSRYGPVEPSDDGGVAHESHEQVGRQEDAGVGGNGDEAEESEEEDDNSDHGAPEATSSAVASGNASRMEKLEHVAHMDAISTDMAYIEPEPPDTSVSTFNLDCDGLTTMITAMGGRGWMDQRGEWADGLLRIEEESRAASEVIGANDCKKLFHEIIALWRSLKDIPKAPSLNLQARYLREHSRKIQKHLKLVRTLTGQVKSDASKSNLRRGNSKSKRNVHAQGQQRDLLKRIHGMLIPALVLALKEALLLGGYSRLRTKPEVIGCKGGLFMACTLQFALRVVGFIDQLYGVAMAHLPPEKEKESAAATARRRTRMEFANCMQVLKPRILAGMNELKRLAESPPLQVQLAERSRSLREAQEERDRIIRQKKDEQMMLFVASTKRMPEDTPKPRDEYYDRHGWRLWEDEVLLGVIRKTRSPNLVLLTRQVPGRSLGEVTNRVIELREWIKAKYEAAGVLPPKWCYHS